MIRIYVLLSVLLSAGCSTYQPAIGEAVFPPTGPDGIRVEDRVSMDIQRHRYAVEMTKQLIATPDREIIAHLSPLKHPTVAVKYIGKPPTGIFDGEELLKPYRASRIDGDTVVYDTDLAKMTMILERRVDDEPFDYRELTSTVPYGYCLDFIDENLGKESREPRGYILRKVMCSQDALGNEY